MERRRGGGQAVGLGGDALLVRGGNTDEGFMRPQ